MLIKILVPITYCIDQILNYEFMYISLKLWFLQNPQKIIFINNFNFFTLKKNEQKLIYKIFFSFLKYKRYVFLEYSAPVINILRSIALIDWKQLMKYKDTIFSTTSKQINLGWTTHYQTQSAVNFVSFMSQIGYHFIIVYLILLLVSLIHICLARDILQGKELD